MLPGRQKTIRSEQWCPHWKSRTSTTRIWTVQGCCWSLWNTFWHLWKIQVGLDFQCTSFHRNIWSIFCSSRRKLGFAPFRSKEFLVCRNLWWEGQRWWFQYLSRDGRSRIIEFIRVWIHHRSLLRSCKSWIFWNLVEILRGSRVQRESHRGTELLLRLGAAGECSCFWKKLAGQLQS